jgi:uncharacterized Fe-S radical SAM superfamily protein PflX
MGHHAEIVHVHALDAQTNLLPVSQQSRWKVSAKCVLCNDHCPLNRNHASRRRMG